jgi:hypothetical protein
MTAIRYPYILAFEPTFVEIRNVETGSMAQVIQGNNLRCLYTDAPSYLQWVHSRYSGSSFSSYSVGVFAHGNLSESPPSFRTFNGQSPVPPYPGQSPTLSYGRAMGQEEIIFVSDDRVLSLRMAAQTGQ